LLAEESTQRGEENGAERQNIPGLSEAGIRLRQGKHRGTPFLAILAEKWKLIRRSFYR